MEKYRSNVMFPSSGLMRLKYVTAQIRVRNSLDVIKQLTSVKRFHGKDV